MLSSAAAIVGGLYVGTQSSGAGRRSFVQNRYLERIAGARVARGRALPVCRARVVPRTRHIARCCTRGPPALSMSAWAPPNCCPMVAILPFMLYQLAGFGTLHFVVSKPANWAINIGIFCLDRRRLCRQPRRRYGARRALTGFSFWRWRLRVLRRPQTQADADGLRPGAARPRNQNRATTECPDGRGSTSCGGSAIGVKARPASKISASSRTTAPRGRCIPCFWTRPLMRTRCTLPAASRLSATISTSPTHGARTAMSSAIAAVATLSALPALWWPPKHVSAMVHPFDVELGDDGRLYASCQDTNTVLAILPKTRKPAPVAMHLRKSFPRALSARDAGRLQPGPSARSAARTPPPNVPPPQGLKVVLDEHGKPRHSVRGIIVHRKHLYVADEAGTASRYSRSRRDGLSRTSKERSS